MNVGSWLVRFFVVGVGGGLEIFLAAEWASPLLGGRGWELEELFFSWR